MRNWLLFGVLSAFCAGTLAAQDVVLVDMRRLSAHELRSEGFALSEAGVIRIDAVGADGHRTAFWVKESRGAGWRGNAWILDARTRRVVWELERAHTRSTRKNLEQYEGTLELPAGDYEVYYASYSGLWNERNFDLRWLVGRKDRDDDDGLSENFRLTIRGQGRRLSPSDLNRLHDDLRANSVLRLTSARPDEAERHGFELKAPTSIDVYAVGELGPGSAHDAGWIIDTNTGRKVWAFEYEASEPAGGARKNRQAHASKTLPAGRYAAVFSVDDSHDPRDWNAPPPHDPASWGLTVTVRPEDRDKVSTFAYDPTPESEVIAAVTRVRNGQTRSQGFTLTRPLDVRVYALGEGSDQAMHDYGWIIDAATRRRVWVMSYDRTQHAGGARKNRLANQVQRLEAGSYVVYYQADDSHAFRSWNAAAPIGGEDWGITILPASGTLDRTAIAPFDPSVEETASVIARLTDVGDDETRSRTFTLNADTEVRIYALGEGNGEMFDYAWIENARTRARVWTMQYDATEHAGGAQKNRLFDGVIRLPAGEYALRYRSDGSHSPDAWNADPPYDPAMWGITLFRVR